MALFSIALWQFSAYSQVRAAARASKRFNAAVRETNSDELISAARALWKATRKHPEVMLAAGEEARRAGRQAEAVELYELVLDSEAPTEVKLPAKLAVVALKWAGKNAEERKASAGEVRRGLEEAAGLAADSPDVELNGAILEALTGERSKALEKIEASLGKIKRGRSAFRSTLWSAYVTAAACAVDADDLRKALEWLKRARTLEPASGRKLAPQQLKLRLALAAHLGANKNTTRMVLADLEREKAAKFTGDEKYDLAVARAIAFLNIEDNQKAIASLDEAIELDPDGANAHMALAFVKYRMHSRRRRIVLNKAKDHRKYLAGIRQPKKWKAVHRVASSARRFPSAALKEAIALHSEEEEFIAHLRKACESGQLPADRAAAARWFLALVYMRQAWSLCDEPEAEERLRLAEEMVRTVVSGDPKNAAASRALGMLAAMKGDVKAAMEAFRMSVAAQPAQEALSKLVGGLAAEPKIASCFPQRQARCATPVVGAVVEVRSWKGLDPERSKLFLDGSEVRASVLPAAVCHIPQRPLSDGSHSVRVVAVDLMGNSAEVSFSFVTDGTPPRMVKFSPGRGESAAGPRVPLKISLSDDQSGVRADSVRVVLFSAGGMMRFTDVLVDGGRYTRSHASGEVSYRAGTEVDPSGFTVVNWRPLGSGEYDVEVYAADLCGNEMPVFKTKIVVGGGR